MSKYRSGVASQSPNAMPQWTEVCHETNQKTVVFRFQMAQTEHSNRSAMRFQSLSFAAAIAALSCFHSATAQTALQDHIAWSIAHEGCAAFSGNTLNPPKALRECFLQKERHNEEATRLLRELSSDELARAIEQSLPLAYKQYQIPANFEWVLSHEHQLNLFRELGRSKGYSRIRTIYYLRQLHNPNAKNVLNAVSDEQIQGLLDRTRLVVAINAHTSYDSLKTLDSMTAPQLTTIELPTTLASLLNSVYGSSSAGLTKLVLEKNQRLFARSGNIAPSDVRIPIGSTVILPSLGRMGSFESIALQPLSGSGGCPTCAVIDPRLSAIVDLGHNGTPAEFERFGHIETPVGSLQSVTEPAAANYGGYLKSLGINSIESGDLNLISTVPIAVIDSGVETTHPDLMNSFWSTPSALADARWPAGAFGYDFVLRSTTPSDQSKFSHGTHVSGLVIGEQLSKWKPDLGKILANKLRLVELKIAGPDGIVDTATAENAILAGIGKNVKIFNCSFELAYESEMLKAYLKNPDRAASALFVVAAGNEGAGKNKGANLDASLFDQETFKDGSIPLSDVILVAALGVGDKIAPFSNYGPKTVTIAAPGSSISSTIRGHGYGLLNGTSQAAPFVTLTAAILLSELPSMSPPEIHQRITDTCDWIDDLKPFVRDGCRLNMQKATIVNADLLQLRAGDVVLKGSVSTSQFGLPKSGSISSSQKFERVWFDDAGQMVIVTTGGRFTTSAATTTLIKIDLATPSQCPGHSSGKSCTIPVSLIRDIVFRASSL